MTAEIVVPKLSPSEARARIAEGDVLVLDVREPAELLQTGKLKAALNIPKSRLADRADPRSAEHDPVFSPAKTILVHCAAGARAASAGQTLKALGYDSVYNIGGFKDLSAAGIETEPA
ncbi:rhodanese [Aureimonas sp. Leaf454]|uniref:rhodanese-like domain-containing protein n=1 Tax=Aureimonas sp. Leaf454 TaxID=1736381 RepID=UPI0006F8BA95|nr:rhodanese-like domain-containing protein [Aureimonas sp. Leaf454]KQT44496.1 rhodanese [Aureimonas sp. Leaf454]